MITVDKGKNSAEKMLKSLCLRRKHREIFCVNVDVCTYMCTSVFLGVYVSIFLKMWLEARNQSQVSYLKTELTWPVQILLATGPTDINRLDDQQVSLIYSSLPPSTGITRTQHHAQHAQKKKGSGIQFRSLCPYNIYFIYCIFSPIRKNVMS